MTKQEIGKKMDVRKYIKNKYNKIEKNTTQAFTSLVKVVLIK